MNEFPGPQPLDVGRNKRNKKCKKEKSSTREVRMDLKGILVTSEWEVCPVGRSWEHEKGKDM